MKLIRSLSVLVAVFAILINFSGCTTLADAKMAEGTGQRQIYNKDYDTVWKMSIEVLNSMNLPLAEQSKSQGYILAQTSISLVSYGENIAVFIKKRGANETSVEVVSKRVMTTNIFAPDWSKDILQRLSAKLN
jgi:hypothetical protein